MACRETVPAVTVGVLQPGPQTIRLPVTGAAELRLEIPGCNRDDRILVVGNPVARMVVVELDVSAGAGIQEYVRSIAGRVATIIFIPRTV